MHDKHNSKSGVGKNNRTKFVDAIYLDDCYVFCFNNIEEAKELVLRCNNSDSGFVCNNYYCVDFVEPLSESNVYICEKGLPIPCGVFAVKKSLMLDTIFRDDLNAFILELTYGLAEKGVYLRDGVFKLFKQLTPSWYSSLFCIVEKIKPNNSLYLSDSTFSNEMLNFKPLIVSGILSWSTKAVFNGYVKAFRNYGIVVKTFEFDSIFNSKPESYGEEKWLNMVRTMLIGLCNTAENDFTHVVFIDGLSIQPWVIGSIKQKTILISTEDPHSNDLTHLMYPMYDYAFSNDLNSAKAFGSYYLPTAFDSFNKVDGDNSLDLLFIGAIYESRLPVLEKFYDICKSKDLNFKIIGPKHYETESVIDEIVEEKIISTEEMVQTIADSKLCLNIFRETMECSLSKNKTFKIEPYDMNPRCFDAIGVGSLLLTDHRDSVVEIYSSEIIYKDGDQEGIINKFIESKCLRNDLLNKLNNKVVNKHTYLNRCVTLLSVVQKDFL